MGPFVVAEFVVAGVCLAIGLIHLLVYVRLQSRRGDLYFSIVAFSTAGSAVFEALAFRSTVLETYTFFFKTATMFQGILWIALIRFIAAYAGTSRRWLIVAPTIAYLIALFVNFWSPGGVLFTRIEALHPVQTAWGEEIMFAIGPTNTWRYFADAGWLLLLGLSVESCLRLFRQNRKRSAMALGLGLFAVLVFAYLHGTLIDLGIVDPPHMLTFSFLGLVFLMKTSLAGDVVRASRLSSEVEAKERRWSELLEGVEMLVASVDSKGLVDYVNPCYSKVTGFATAEIVGRSFIEYLPEEERERVSEQQDALRKGRRATRTLAGIRTKSGEVRMISWSVVASGGDSGEVDGFYVIGSDVTGRLRAEEARDEAFLQLETLRARLEEENVYLTKEISSCDGFSEIRGRSNALLYVLARVREVAATDASVLILGETGVGKELVARAVHRESTRAGRPFIRLNCSTLPENLVESELFGHEAGAFTGANGLRKGRFELADGGTLFLDEVSELPREIQAKLLRVLQDGEYDRLGGSETRRADVRVIAATNRNLQDDVASGRFRADLFYRLNVYPVTVPPLRNRPEDIPELLQHFTREFSDRFGKRVDQVPSGVLAELRRYDWPGNVRELRNLIERAVILSTDSVLRLPERLDGPAEVAPDPAAGPANTAHIRHETLEAVEKRHVRAVLEQTSWRISGPKGAAAILGLNPSTLRFRIRKLGIEKP